MLPDLQLISQMSNNAPQISIFIVLLTSLLLLTVFIWRLGWFDEQTTDTTHVPMTAIGKVHNPFIISLTNAKDASLEDGAVVTITSQVSCCVHVYWGMLIHDVYALIHQAWPTHQQTLQNNVFKEFSLYSEETIELEPITEKVQLLKPPNVEFNSQLGAPPRDRYPMVIVMCDLQAMDGSVDDTLCNQVVCSVTMFHIKDEVCPGESHVVAQYVRTPYGRPCNLKQLYITTDENSSSSTSAASQSHDEVPSHSAASSQCVICLSNDVERALLPCRHACVCDSCFSRLTHCPMCRTIIGSAFRVSNAS